MLAGCIYRKSVGKCWIRHRHQIHNSRQCSRNRNVTTHIWYGRSKEKKKKKRKIEENRTYFKRNGTNGIECNRFLCQIFRFLFQSSIMCVCFFLFSSLYLVYIFYQMRAYTRLSFQACTIPVEARDCVISIIHFVLNFISLLLLHSRVVYMCVPYSLHLGDLKFLDLFFNSEIFHSTKFFIWTRYRAVRMLYSNIHKSQLETWKSYRGPFMEPNKTQRIYHITCKYLFDFLVCSHCNSK